jgi:hypothetical protein
VKRFAVMTEEDRMKNVESPGALCFEILVAGHSSDCVWGGFEENTPASRGNIILHDLAARYCGSRRRLGACCQGSSTTVKILH